MKLAHGTVQNLTGNRSPDNSFHIEDWIAGLGFERGNYPGKSIILFDPVTRVATAHRPSHLVDVLGNLLDVSQPGFKSVLEAH
ncbi:hypothetical protein E2562_008860 [Oryza meyeriana var. granulata]|uniref:Uncharacterized protein n=1 Tax=Oryza meyeriana var. granulata TaxID=110450 RepID=A0A6G1D0B6_9ORYZ|nr:hypothetical protein E2562_008860 [Oryza meyeriana var. granulata]